MSCLPHSTHSLSSIYYQGVITVRNQEVSYNPRFLFLVLFYILAMVSPLFTASQIQRRCSWQKPDRARKNNLFDGVDEQLHKLGQYIKSEPLEPEEKVIGQQALTALSSSFEAFESAELPLECGMAFFWPLSVHEGFVSLVQQKNIIACILIAYYCAQLHTLGQYWFIGRKAHFLLSEIASILPSKLLYWIDWPKSILCKDYVWVGYWSEEKRSKIE